jgi:hypothetical protein
MVATASRDGDSEALVLICEPDDCFSPRAAHRDAKGEPLTLMQPGGKLLVYEGSLCRKVQRRSDNVFYRCGR